MVRSGEEGRRCSFIAFAVESLWPGEKIPGLFLILMAANVVEGESVLVKEVSGNGEEFETKIHVTFYSD